MTATATNLSKSATSTFTNASRSAVSVSTIVKAGAGWLYDQVGITYDGVTDTISGHTVYYDTEGTLSVFTNLTKS